MCEILTTGWSIVGLVFVSIACLMLAGFAIPLIRMLWKIGGDI